MLRHVLHDIPLFFGPAAHRALGAYLVGLVAAVGFFGLASALVHLHGTHNPRVADVLVCPLARVTGMDTVSLSTDFPHALGFKRFHGPFGLCGGDA